VGLAQALVPLPNLLSSQICKLVDREKGPALVLLVEEGDLGQILVEDHSAEGQLGRGVVLAVLQQEVLEEYVLGQEEC
jgi:hypothetical protein